MLPNNQRELDIEVGRFVGSKLWMVSGMINTKVHAITKYLSEANITDVVVGVSGGIDSAVVIGLLNLVKQRIPLTIHAYTINFDLYNGIFEDNYVRDLKEAFGSGVNFKIIDATDGFKMLMLDLGVETSNHVKAQASYALRYQMLFTYAQVHNAITIGTTNRDEFEYVGWFGKNSDMVVDLQVITGWNKCQVVKAARVLGVPDSIINRAPVGDLLDLSTDEENFGCTYNELAYFQEKVIIYPFFHHPEFLKEKFAKVRALHEKNKHKYQGQTFNPVFL